ncbi:MAG: hypothetical protein K2Q32_04640 [Alphaproteobacteria bacterium]|nr:hypothetical protein [Alphaproteobacteria bacterium]
MEARRERIAEMAKMLLPCVEDCRRKEQRFKNLLLSSYILFAFLGGYLVHENTRPINTNEYTILSSMIYMRAQENNTTPALIADELTKLYHVQTLQNLKARNWNDALNYLASRHPI